MVFFSVEWTPKKLIAYRWMMHWCISKSLEQRWIQAVESINWNQLYEIVVMLLSPVSLLSTIFHFIFFFVRKIQSITFGWLCDTLYIYIYLLLFRCLFIILRKRIFIVLSSLPLTACIYICLTSKSMYTWFVSEKWKEKWMESKK